ncbi:Bromodomain-containing protein [Poronia punctata]|nr:Bromodomain-containing protein [Poronia punctata]
MESKRKMSGTNGLETAADTDRVAKRRKLMEEYGDLSKGETNESTTAYGLSILESIRATTDKNGRAVSPFFETLPSRTENPEYYKQIRLPLSLGVIERKLKDKEYPHLSSLESDFKRLVSNAKETNDRGSTIFGDAERVRKAVSNLMVKHNPAYKSGNYQAVPTPLPPTPGPEEEDEPDEKEEDDNNVEDNDDENDGISSTMDAGADHVDEAEAEGEDEESDQDEEDEKAEDEEQEGGEEKDEDNDENEDNEDNENEDKQENGNDNNDDDGPQPRRRRASTTRKSETGASRDSATPARRSVQRQGKADHHYENVPFAGLSFQQAQEKVVEELIRHKEDSDEYPYFEPFLYLPPRTLKDYYEVIAEPLSLKKLQKQVLGRHGRGEATYISDFKGWSALEDQASLMWKNAYHYNEDGSEIFSMAQELEEMFHRLVKEAKEKVPEPPQPKIKLKLPNSGETSSHPKKITIHVGGKNSAAGSPAPATAHSGESETTRIETPVPVQRSAYASAGGTLVNLGPRQNARSLSASVGPPSPRVLGVAAKAQTVAKTEDPVPTPSIARPQVTATTFKHFVPVTANTQVVTPSGNAPTYPLPQHQAPPPPPPPPRKSPTDILEATRYRPVPIRESDALMPRLVVTSHPSVHVEHKLMTSFTASTTEYQKDVVLNVPATHFRVQLRPQVAAFLEAQQREWKLNVFHDTTRLYPTVFHDKREPIFDATLRYGVNRVEVTLIAALPKGQKAPNGLTMEMERFVVHFNVLRH